MHSRLSVFVAPSVKYSQYGESRYLGEYWVPVEDPVFSGDRVRQDGVSLFYCQVNSGGYLFTGNEEWLQKIDSGAKNFYKRHSSNILTPYV